MTRVGLNLLFLCPGQVGGSGVYAHGLIPELLRCGSDHDFVLFVSGPAGAEARGRWGRDAEIVEVPLVHRSLPLRLAAEQLLLPVLARRHALDVLHGLASTCPSRLRGTANVVTILDLIQWVHPETHPPRELFYVKTAVSLAAKRADRIIAISGHTRRDLEALLHIPRERVDVVHLAHTPAVQTAQGSGASRNGLVLGLDRERPILVSASAKRPHKNLERLITALSLMTHAPAPVLAIPGYPTPWEGGLRRHAEREGVGDRVKFMGWLSDDDLDRLYRMATLSVYPSLYEGFGLPLLESMERGVPVASSNASCLPEIGGDAVAYFDPRDANEMARTIDRLLGNAEARARLVEAGRERLSAFSWEKAARETLTVYRRTLAGLDQSRGQ